MTGSSLGGGGVFSLSADMAHRFESVDAADQACTTYLRHHTSLIYGTVGGDFRVWRATFRTTLAAVEPGSAAQE